MANLYTKKSAELKKIGPRPETVSFLLNYSRALRVVDYKEIKFETLLN
ncbi:hypothetical protein [Sinomicrobium weinanense]|uniref:Uncharacterized protein n=1 Tax=Sinomicrobium weinanense TaxID=2842200 RepID=A0A926JVX0_9FLAO|nr:hypothetical protein [Sinomicrobium weinanense]MBC9798162.1 hypothetical protein [Sinomicrobium weinanense]MBU3122126.1 hypothetical protein [Sinomicrobium weinanense]